MGEVKNFMEENIDMVNNYGEIKKDQNLKQTPRKVKRVSVSSKRQISIPKEYFDALDIDDEVLIEDTEKQAFTTIEKLFEDDKK